MDPQTEKLLTYGDHNPREDQKNETGYIDSLEVGSSTPICDQTVNVVDMGGVNNSQPHASLDTSDNLASKRSLFDSDLPNISKKLKTDTYEYNYLEDGATQSVKDLQSFQRRLQQSDISHDDKISQGSHAFREDGIEAATHGETEKPDSQQTISEVLNRLSQESKLSCMQWVDILNESESFEKFCPTRLESILQEAKQLEKALKQQKEVLCHRLKALSKTLQML